MNANAQIVELRLPRMTNEIYKKTKVKMKNHRIVMYAFTIFISTLLVSSCGQKHVPRGDIYRHHSEYKGSDGANDIQVETTKDGSLIMTAMGESSHAPAILPFDNATGNIGSPKWIPDALGSRNIKIVINQEVGYTEIAGLRFREEAVINIGQDGAVEVNKEGVEASDKTGNFWISKNVKIEGSDSLTTVMIKTRR